MATEEDGEARKRRADRLHDLVEDLTRKRLRPQKLDDAGAESCEPAESPREFIERRMTELDD